MCHRFLPIDRYNRYQSNQIYPFLSIKKSIPIFIDLQLRAYCNFNHTTLLIKWSSSERTYSDHCKATACKKSKNTDSRRSRRSELVAERENGRLRGRHACLLLARSFFLVPTTSKRLLHRLKYWRTKNTLSLVCLCVVTVINNRTRQYPRTQS